MLGEQLDEGLGAARPDEKRIAIVGGTGFVGSRLRRSLNGHPLAIISRNATASGQSPSERAEFFDLDINAKSGLEGALRDCWAVVNLVAVIEERGDATFDRVIRQGVERLIGAAKAAGVERFVQISAIGTRNDPVFPYFQAKFRAEEAVQSSGLAWTILRPSIVFGKGDGFISQLAQVVRKAPAIPILGSGNARFQPISVIDLGDAIAQSLFLEETIGQTIELAGPEQITLREMMDLVANKLGKTRPHLKVPIPAMRAVIAASRVLPKSLRPPVTVHQLAMLKIDNTADDSGTARLIGRPPRGLADGIDYILEKT